MTEGWDTAMRKPSDHRRRPWSQAPLCLSQRSRNRQLFPVCSTAQKAAASMNPGRCYWPSHQLFATS